MQCPSESSAYCSDNSCNVQYHALPKLYGSIAWKMSRTDHTSYYAAYDNVIYIGG